MMRFGALAGCAVLAALVAHPAWAQAHNPFGVGISEGGGSAHGLTGWLLSQQASFERQLSMAVRSARQDGSALWWLTGLSFVYGVFHAAGPGHGKAVLTSYLFANERALRRGLILSLCAALLQGVVAIVLVGMLALVFHATAQGMKQAASLVESLTFAGVALLGAWLVWKKGRLFVQALRDIALPGLIASSAPLATYPAALGREPTRSQDDCNCAPLIYRPSWDAGSGTRFAAQTIDDAVRSHGLDCGHFHAPDPSTLGEGFSWREAILTVVAAGARPCSGAILVLVFALTQGMFSAGILATMAMALGVAITTGALAATAVLAKAVALRLTARRSRGGLVMIRGLETAAALLVLVAGLSLFFGYTALGGA